MVSTQNKQNEESLYSVLSTCSKGRMINTNQGKQNGHIIVFHQLVQKLEWTTAIISTIQNKQNEWSLYRVSSAGSKVRMNNINHFYSSRQTKRMAKL